MREGWTYKKLGEVAQSDLGKTLNSSKDKGTLYPYLCAVNVLWDNIDTTTLKETRFEESELERYSVKKGDLLICEGGDIGRAAIWGKEKSIQYQNALHRVRFNGEVFPRFCLLYLRCLKGKGVLDARYGKGVTIKHLVKSALLSIPIPIPPLSEQEHIVSELDLLSSIIEKKKEQLKEYDQLAQSIFYDMFGDPVTNEKGWNIECFGDIAFFKNGLNYHPKDNGFMIKCIGVGDFQDRKELRDFALVKDFAIDEVVDESYYLKDGDIIIVRSNGSKELVGRNMIVYPKRKKVTYSGFCIRCRLNTTSIMPIILNRILSDSNTMIVMRQEGRGCNISNINQKILSSLPIIMPPLDLQKLFASKIEAIERQKTLIKQSIVETETLFDSRMDYWFG